MKNEALRIVIAESSVIVRSGIISILKHIPDTANVQIMEVGSSAALQNCLQTHVPVVLIIDPVFESWFRIDEFRMDPQTASVKCIAMVCTMLDPSQLRRYDEVINLLDDADTLYRKIISLLHSPDELDDADAEMLSMREREVIACVVKGMTNKEISEKLYISIHTVITHRRNISRKLQIHSPAGLTIYAIANKLVDVKDIKL